MRFSVHAVEQYIVRFRPEMRYPAAVAELQAHAHTAVRTRDHTAGGEHVYLLPELNCRLVTKVERGGPICVTVLPREGDVELPPAPDVDPGKEREAALSALSRYLDGKAHRGDHEARRLLSRLRVANIL